ncbi:hypothetical protein CDAR_276021 [Caerostris darwini]|uniref:Uncharacterized protein n=1 Tax=Caerostris darwini TaxID=1538125 RepID=A0AAV4QGX6_9ARAC|nr:hypothetical protein CDAR_276021 [Caerostris darwini]
MCATSETQFGYSCMPGLATSLGSGVYALIAVAAHDHSGPSVVLSILMAAVTSCLGVESIENSTSINWPEKTSSLITSLLKTPKSKAPKKITYLPKAE